MNCETYQDLVAAHVDGVLTAAERQEVEAHLSTCAHCQRVFAEEKRFHAAFVARRLIVPVPAEVEQRLHSALCAESEVRPPVWKRLGSWLEASLPRARVVAGLAAAGLLLALLLPRLFSPDHVPDLLSHAVDYYQAATAGRTALTYATDDPHALETTLNNSGRLDFRTRVIDFRPAGYRLRGGAITRMQDHPAALTVYEGDDAPIICLRQGGKLPSIPPGAERLDNEHYLYTHAGHTVLLSQFPDHFCILISRLPREAFLRRLALLPVS
ncbi:MAG: zf-HC2 domain-containing protein [Thermodesulfobacteriota bacterium]|jgi:anti-sigma factor RsiW